jgi:hypothetical protein
MRGLASRDIDKRAPTARQSRVSLLKRDCPGSQGTIEGGSFKRMKRQMFYTNARMIAPRLILPGGFHSAMTPAQF